MATTTVPITLEEFMRLPDDGNKHEISDGELITMPPPKFRHTRLLRKLFKLLDAYLEKSGTRRSKVVIYCLDFP